VTVLTLSSYSLGSDTAVLYSLNLSSSPSKCSLRKVYVLNDLGSGRSMYAVLQKATPKFGASMEL